MKAMIQIGYKTYVLAPEKAVALAGIISGAEIYTTKWHKDFKEGEQYTHHIYSPDANEKVNIEFVTDEYVAMCRLAGKPD
jgi:hypothetical protein